MPEEEYKPLTPVEDYPLHPTDTYFLEPGMYWACKQPERPRDKDTLYDWRCRGCVIAAEAHVKIHGDQELWWLNEVTMSYMVERSKALGVMEP